MINAAIIDGGTLIIPHITLKMSKEGAITDEGLLSEIEKVLQALEQACS
jgi:hypothetical protein